MLVTLEVLKLSGWSNADAPENMKPMFVTLEVSQLEISALKSFKLKHSQLMSVTLEVLKLSG